MSTQFQNLLLVPVSAVLIACGDEAETQTAASERDPRIATSVAEVGSPFNPAAEKAFIDALLAKDDPAMEALITQGNYYARLHWATQVATRDNPSADDVALARSYMEDAIEAGNANTMFIKSQDLMADGELYAKDVEAGHALGLKAAEAGDSSAMLQAGIRYQYGVLGAEQSDEDARKWLSRALENGERAAQRSLDELNR